LCPVQVHNGSKEWELKEGVNEVSALKVWQNCCHYLYLPRLVNDSVFRNAITQGIEGEDYFAFASGKEGDRYLGFTFGRNSIATVDESSLLIDREAAVAYRERTQQPTPPTAEPGTAGGEPRGTTIPVGGASGTGTPTPTYGGLGGAVTTTPAATKKQFYGTISLDPVKAKMDFATIMDEVVQQFTAKLGVNVMISVEIEADSQDGFNESMQRTVKENCNVLKFSSAEFEEES